MRPPPTMSKEPERNTNRHMHSMHDQIKHGIRASFQKEEKEVVSAIDLKQGRLGPVYQKER